MRYLTEHQLRELEAEALAREIADDAAALCRRARRLDCVLEIGSIAFDSISIVNVRPRDLHAAAQDCAVPA